MKKEQFIYDRSLREIFQNIPKKLITILTGQDIKEVLDISFPKVEERRVDLLAKLQDDTLFHLEIQSTNDKTMPKRMLKYLSLIYDKYDQIPLQVVLYIGEKQSSIKNTIIGNNLKYSYMVQDIKDIDCIELIESDNINDNILALLCNIKNFDKILSKLKEKLSKLEPKQREDYLRKVFYLLRLRPKLNEFFTTKQQQELAMPFTLVKDKDPWYKEGIEKGIKKGREEGREKALLETALLMIQEYNLPLEDVSKKLNISKDILENKLKESKD